MTESKAETRIVTKVGQDLEGIGCTEAISTLCQNVLTLVTLILMTGM